MSVNELPSLATASPRPARRPAAQEDAFPASASLVDQARTITACLPALMRQLFTFEDDPIGELPLAQLRVCSLLYDGPRSMSALSRELGVSLSAITQVADRLERARLVKRILDGTDRRLRCLQLTKRGDMIMRQHEEARMQSVLAVLQSLPAAAGAEIAAALQSLTQASAERKRLPAND